MLGYRNSVLIAPRKKAKKIDPILLILSTGLSLETAFSTIFSCLNNLGPALGEATNNYASLNDASKIILSFTMILGRLEIYTLLVLFTTFFWRY